MVNAGLDVVAVDTAHGHSAGGHPRCRAAAAITGLTCR